MRNPGSIILMSEPLCFGFDARLPRRCFSECAVGKVTPFGLVLSRVVWCPPVRFGACGVFLRKHGSSLKKWWALRAYIVESVSPSSVSAYDSRCSDSHSIGSLRSAPPGMGILGCLPKCGVQSSPPFPPPLWLVIHSLRSLLVDSLSCWDSGAGTSFYKL